MVAGTTKLKSWDLNFAELGGLIILFLKYLFVFGINGRVGRSVL